MKIEHENADQARKDYKTAAQFTSLKTQILNFYIQD